MILSFKRALTVAAGLHLAAAVVVVVHDRGARPPSGDDTPAGHARGAFEVLEVDVDVDVAGSPSVEGQSGAAGMGDAIASVAARGHRDGPVIRAPAASSDVEPGPGEAHEGPSASSREDFSFDPTLGVTRSGAAWNARADKRSQSLEASRLAERSTRKTTLGDGLAQALRARDVERGIGAGGAVIARLRSVLRASTLAVEGRYRIAVVFDAAGRIREVTLLESAGAPAGELERDARRALEQLRVKISPPSEGLRVIVAIDSRVTLPSGARRGVETAGPGARFDLSDIGAKPSRVLHAHVESETLL